MDNYNDIIHLPYPVSETHLQMSMIDRAAQFSPFAALSGYDAAVKETARITDRRVELDEDEKTMLNERLRLVTDCIEECPEITITYFKPDEKKCGGAYLTVTGGIKKVDDFEHIVCLTDGTKILMDDIFEITGELIRTYFDDRE